MTVKKIDVQLNINQLKTSLSQMKSEMDKNASSSANADKMMQQYNKTLKAIQSSASGMSLHLNKLTGTIGLSLGFKSLISQAHEANMYIWQLHNSVKDMTDQFGDTGKVMSAVWKAYGSSSVSLQQTMDVMRSLNQAGLEVNDSLSSMAGWIGRVGQASGVGFDVLGKFSGTMMRYWKTGEKGAKDMLHAIFSVKGAYGMTSAQVQELIGLTQKVHDTMATMFTDGVSSSIALSRGISKAVGTMTAFGISSEKAASFVEKILDPEQLSQNTALLRRMGITYRDQVEMMTTAGGKETFFDKLMTKLPTISNQLASIRDPFVRMNVAKNLGIPMEIASKFAGKTADEIQEQLNLMKDQKKAADIQQKKMKAQQERYDEAKKWLKFNALMPLMEWAQRMYKYMWPFLQAVSNGMKKANTYFVGFLDGLFNSFKPVYDIITGRQDGKLIEAFGKAALNGFSKLVTFIATNIPTIIQTMLPVIIDGISTGVKTFIDAIPILISGVGNLITTGFEKGLGTGSLIMGFLTMKLWSWVKDAAIQYLIIQRNWMTTNMLLTRIATNGVAGGAGDAAGGLLQKIFGKKVPAGVTGTVAKAGTSVATNAISTGTQVATKTGVAAGAMKGIELAKTGLGSMAGTFERFIPFIKGASTLGKVVPVLGAIITAAQIIPGILNVIKGIADPKNIKDNYKFTLEEEAKLQQMRETGIITDQQLWQRRKDASEYENILLRQKKGYTSIIAEMEDKTALERLEKGKKEFQFWRTYGGAMFGTFDTIANVLPFVKINTAQMFKDWIDGSKESANIYAVNRQAAEDFNNEMKKKKGTAGNQGIDKQYFDQMKKINSLEQEYSKTKDDNTKKKLQQEKDELLQFAKSTGIKGQLINDLDKLTSDQFYNQTKNIMMVSGEIGSAADRMKYFASQAEQISKTWDVKGIKERWYAERKEIEERNAKYKKYSAMEEENTKEMLKSMYGEGSEEYKKALQTIESQKLKGEYATDQYKVQSKTDDIMKSFLEDNKKTGQMSFNKYDAMVKELNNLNFESDAQKQGTLASFEQLKKIRTESEASGKTGLDLLNVQITALKQSQDSLKAQWESMGWWEKKFSDKDESLSQQYKKNDEMLASLIAQRNDEASKAAQRHKENSKALGGIGGATGKIAKNTEKETVNSVDYIGNMLRYIGSNADLRTVGF